MMSDSPFLPGFLFTVGIIGLAAYFFFDDLADAVTRLL
ncbi:hypothetical protein ABIE63_003233 [Limibacillus sp. MBR-115]|uniref:Uncharacterized protein n=1 Tax=Limibacillus halophilus TaxID=1579333 RepID=A0A839SSQ9_9PROT|nr:hypothetical protein [Limibacillus halophilus]